MMKRSIPIAALFLSSTAIAQTTAPLAPSAWTASDNLRIEMFLGRESVYIDKGVAVIDEADFRDGTIKLDMAGTTRSNFMGIAFHAADVDNSEVVFFRFGSSGTSEAV